MKHKRSIFLLPILAVLLSGCDWMNNIIPGGSSSAITSASSASTKTTSQNSQPSTQSTTSMTSWTKPVSSEYVDRYKKGDVELGDYYHDVFYAEETGEIVNTYKEGGVNYDGQFNVYNGKDYTYKTTDTRVTPEKNNYDMVIPDTIDKNAENKVILMIHGGAWIGGNKDDMAGYFTTYANKGYIVVNMLYNLLGGNFKDMTLGAVKDLSIYRMLDEIDACITHLKGKLVSLGFNANKLKLVLCGVSSGSHISMLYAYSRGSRSAIPISFLVNAVGPVSIKTSSWLQFKNESSALDGGITPAAIAEQKAAGNIKVCETHFEFGSYVLDLTWNDAKTMEYANAMCGRPYAAKFVREAMNEDGTVDMSKDAAKALVNHFEDTISVPTYIDNGEYPMICAYGGKDRIVGIGQYAELEPALLGHSIEHEFFYFKNSGHELGYDSEVQKSFYHKIDEWLESK